MMIICPVRSLDLRLPKPDYNLEVGSGSHAEQTGNTMIAYERICILERPDLVIVVAMLMLYWLAQ